MLPGFLYIENRLGTLYYHYSMHEKMEKRKQILKKMKSCNSAERHKLENEIDIIENELSEDYKAKQIEKLQEHLDIITDTEGRVSTRGAWKLRQKVLQKPPEQLTSKMDKNGNIVTNPTRIKEIYLEAYKDRLKHREIIPELQNLKVIRKQLFQQRLEQCKLRKSPHGQWTNWKQS